MTFEETRWSLVLKAGQNGVGGRDAMETLCKQYWQPLYAFLRAKGLRKEDAADVLQGFFCHILERSVINRADPKIGRFRSYLLTILSRYAANEHAKSNAIKRGGRATLISIDAEGAESLYSQVSQKTWNPEELYERQWAMNILNQALDQLEQEYREAGKLDFFETLRPALVAGEGMAPYSEVSERLNMKEATVRVAVHRLRNRYRKTLLKVVAHTVNSPDDLESEVLALLEILGRPTNSG